MNEHSSRSHTIFQVTLEQKPRPDGTGNDSPEGEAGSQRRVVRRAKVNLVDLAGSEKWKPHLITAEGMSERRINEMTAINQSLSNLGNCIRALSESGRTHIPYRNSKLTRLLQVRTAPCPGAAAAPRSPTPPAGRAGLVGRQLQDCVRRHHVALWGRPGGIHFHAQGAQAATAPAAGLHTRTPSPRSAQFADRAKRVVVHASVNETLDDASLVKRYEHEIARLKVRPSRCGPAGPAELQALTPARPPPAAAAASGHAAASRVGAGLGSPALRRRPARRGGRRGGAGAGAGAPSAARGELAPSARNDKPPQ